ncbi:UBX domain-containing protein 2 [Nakaseomyces bracarensis]|uniref:UBX domain-containing protein 2 n=1 Tax=Nakaseomyces bracarensis TaxID=273131 RepID=A0ABR4NVK2_9SACH
MSEQEQVDNFMAITAATDGEVAKQFIEMAGGDLETAISLYFEHGAGVSAPGGANAGAPAATETDNDLAERLQQEAYREEEQVDSVREPDQARHETLAETHIFPATYGGIGGAYSSLRHHTGNVAADMFDDSTPQGIFNQRLEDDYSDETSSSESSSSVSGSISDTDEDSDNDYEYVEEDVVEIDDDGNITEKKQLVRRLKNPITKEAKLAMLFRPPFDMMSKLNLDRAKLKARKKKKWIMVNIQDAGIFQCQALNRDVWSNKKVKRVIKKNFIFLQYQYSSRNAEPYIHFYGLNSKDDLPHIAILDPLTGERLKQWNEIVPNPNSFLEEIDEFLNEFSLDPGSKNPLVKQPTPEIDPTTLTEEQQMELAIRESLGTEATNPIAISDEDVKKTEGNDASIQEDKDEEMEDVPSKDNLFDSIEAIDHEEPEQNIPGKITRIQIRTGDGRRLVRRFYLDDTIRTIYEVIKVNLEGFTDCKFLLSNHQRENLIDKLSETIADAGLGNSSLLVEKEED